MLCSNSKNISRNDMDKSATFDLEADGLLPTATRVWCGVVKDSVTKEIFKYGPNNIHQLLKKLEEYGELKAHNGLGYDFPLLEKLYGWKYKGKKTDTLVLSRLLNPKRVAPYNYSGSAGPHSVEVWGCRLGRKKPDHEDWSKYSEEMLHRCTEDVEIQEQIFDTLIKEMSGGDWSKAVPLTMKLFEYLQMQESYGWKVDTSHMNTCIHQLDFWMDRIDRVLKHHLPFIIEVQEQKEKGEYKYVKKPFLKSGDYSKSTNEWYNSNGSIISTHRVAGPFSRITFRRVDLDKAVEVKKFLLASGWEPLEWNTNDAGEQTSPKLSKDDPFEGIQGGVGRLIARRVQCKQRKGIITGLLSSVREDGRIGSAVNNLAVTGRATHRGIVNIPKVGSFYGKQMRKIFSCPEGKVLVGTDSDGCQLRMLAGRMNNPAYTEALCNGDKSKGTDNHSLTAKIGELESRDIAKNVMYCVPLDTQILTRSGWKTKDEIQIGESVLTYNQEKNIKEWKPVLAIHEKEDEVIKLSHGHNFEIRATKDHRWFVKQRRYIPSSNSYGRNNGRYMDFQIRTTEELNSESNIITNAPMLPDETGEPLEWNSSKYGTDWTASVCKASSYERKGFLAGFLVADGCYQRGKWEFAQNEGPLYEAALTALFIESDGFIHVSTTQGVNFRVKKAILSKKSHTTMTRMKREVLPRQPVWCVSTENESFVIKQGDVITITGNCLLFGGGDTKLAKTARKPIGAGADLRDKLYKGLDGLGELMDSLTKEWRMTAKRRYNTKWNKVEYYNGYITGLDGRPILVPFEHQLLVYLLQSDESIMMSAAYCRFHQRMFKLGYEYGRQWSVIMWMHDEFTCECDEDIADIVAKEAEDAIAWAGNFYNISCPHVGDSKIGRNWYEIH